MHVFVLRNYSILDGVVYKLQRVATSMKLNEIPIFHGISENGSLTSPIFVGLKFKVQTLTGTKGVCPPMAAYK